MKIAVVGTGYVGLVVGACLAENGNDVVCVDKDASKIAVLEGGKLPIYEPGLEELVRRNRHEERLAFTTDLSSAVRASELVFIAVGTPQGDDGSADLQHVLDVARDVGRALNKYTVVVDPGIVINPLQLQRISEGGTVQGISEVMKEGISFDRGMITSRDWVQYPIMRFADVPELKVVLVNNPSVGAYNGAGEGSNGLPYVSIPAAVFDATGKFPRTLPLRPANVRALLNA